MMKMDTDMLAAVKAIKQAILESQYQSVSCSKTCKQRTTGSLL